MFGVYNSDILIIVGKSMPIVKKEDNEFERVKQELLEKGIIGVIAKSASLRE